MSVPLCIPPPTPPISSPSLVLSPLSSLQFPHAVTALSWSSAFSWLAIGGSDGTIALTKLAATTPPPSSGTSSSTPRSAGTLPTPFLLLHGHRGTVRLSQFNEVTEAFASFDSHGTVIIWHWRGDRWAEQEIEYRVRAHAAPSNWAWSADGSKGAVSYDDGTLVVFAGSSRFRWSLVTQLRGRADRFAPALSWSPDGTLLAVSGADDTSVRLYSADSGTLECLLPVVWRSGASGPEHLNVVAIDWFCGPRTQADLPRLAVAFGNGLVQIFKSEADEVPVLVETQTRPVCAHWSPDGGLLAVLAKPLDLVQAEARGSLGSPVLDGITITFYSALGHTLSVLPLVSPAALTFAWHGSGMQLVYPHEGSTVTIAAVSRRSPAREHLFAWIPDAQTLVYTHVRSAADGGGTALVFHSMVTGDRKLRFLEPDTYPIALSALGDRVLVATSAPPTHLPRKRASHFLAELRRQDALHPSNMDHVSPHAVPSGRGGSSEDAFTLLALFASDGLVLATKVVEIATAHLTLTKRYAVASSASVVCVWDLDAELGGASGATTSEETPHGRSVVADGTRVPVPTMPIVSRSCATARTSIHTVEDAGRVSSPSTRAHDRPHRRHSSRGARLEFRAEVERGGLPVAMANKSDSFLAEDGLQPPIEPNVTRPDLPALSTSSSADELSETGPDHHTWRTHGSTSNNSSSTHMGATTDADDDDKDGDDGTNSVDLSNVSAFPSHDAVSYIMVQSPLASSFHSITCQTATDSCIILGRAGGILHFLSLPELRDERRVKLEAPVLALSVNRSGNRLAIVEDPGVVKLLSPMDSRDFLSKPSGSLSHATIQQVVYEVSSLAVWHVQWDRASESRLAICEGNQLHMFANEAHEAAAAVQGTPVYLDSESNTMVSVHLEQVFAQAPSQPLTPSSLFVKWHVQPLREVRASVSHAVGRPDLVRNASSSGHGGDDQSDASGLAMRLLSDLTSSTTDCSRLHRATLSAAATANVPALEALRRESGYDEGPEGVLGARDSDGRSALHWACNGVTSAHTATVALLLKWGADPLLRDLYGLLPLHHAANRGAPLDLIRALFLGAECDGFLVGDHFVQADLDVDGSWCFTDELTIASLQDLDDDEVPASSSPASSSSSSPSPRSARHLPHVEACGATQSVQARLDALLGPESPFLSMSSRPLVVESVSAPDRLGRRALHHAASHGRVDIVIALLDADASLDVTDSRGFTPLHHAAYAGHVQVVRIFSDAGASVHACDDDGRSPLHWACVAGQADVVAFLLSRGAHLLEHDLVGGKTPLHYAARRGHAHVVRILLRTGNSAAVQLVDAWDDCHRTPLHDAVECSHAPAVQLLLKAGANVNAVDVEQLSPLHYAAIANASEEVVMSLLSSELVDPGLQDADGWTPLAHAAARGHAAARDALLHADASHSDYLKLKDLYRRAVEREVALRDKVAVQAAERAASEQERAVAEAASTAAAQATHNTLTALGLTPDSGPPASSALAAWLAAAPFPVQADMASRLASLAAYATSLLASPGAAAVAAATATATTTATAATTSTPRHSPANADKGGDNDDDDDDYDGLAAAPSLGEHLLRLQQPPAFN